MNTTYEQVFEGIIGTKHEEINNIRETAQKNKQGVFSSLNTKTGVLKISLIKNTPRD